MQYNKCRSCKGEFLVKRDFCPFCRSSDFDQPDLNGGVVLYSVKLVATPEGFPNEYYVVMCKFSNVVFFCRSENYLEPGSEITIMEDQNGPVCTSSI